MDALGRACRERAAARQNELWKAPHCVPSSRVDDPEAISRFLILDEVDRADSTFTYAIIFIAVGAALESARRVAFMLHVIRGRGGRKVPSTFRLAGEGCTYMPLWQKDTYRSFVKYIKNSFLGQFLTPLATANRSTQPHRLPSGDLTTYLPPPSTLSLCPCDPSYLLVCCIGKKRIEPEAPLHSVSTSLQKA